MNIKKDDVYDLENIVICALRYALGRRTYVTDEASEFIKKYPELVTERVCIVMLRDLDRYLQDRRDGIIKDDNCDYNNWIDLQNWLFKLAKDKKYNVVGYEVR